MDKILVYADSENIRNKFKNYRFSYQRKYKLTLLQSFEQLSKIELGKEPVLFYVFHQWLDDHLRKVLNSLSFKYPNIKICLCADASFALDAWKLDLFHFIEYPVPSSGLQNAYQKYIKNNVNGPGELTIKGKEGIRKIDFANINYIAASGNYSFIHVDDGSTLIQTKQLKHFNFITEQDGHIQRVHRSLIINLRCIQSIKDQQVLFYNGDSLDLSISLSKKIKKILLNGR